MDRAVQGYGTADPADGACEPVGVPEQFRGLELLQKAEDRGGAI